MQKLAILGSTGNIGKQALDLITQCGDFEVTLLTAHSNYKLLLEQAAVFHPKFIAYDGKEVEELAKDIPQGVRLLSGKDCLVEGVREADFDVILIAIVGADALLPTVEAVKKGKRVALANKEATVIAGDILMRLARECGSVLLPVDSEHSAIWQCIGSNRQYLSRIYLTASGGAFRDYSREMLEQAGFLDAMKHPTWNMGERVTVDSATLVNKGLELIEAVRLFEVEPCEVEVLIHRQSIVHSFVEFQDGSMIAQMSTPDMRLPIEIALYYPKKGPRVIKKHNFADTSLTFEKVNDELFRGLALGRYAIERKGSYPTVFNAADEVAVKLFRLGKINYFGIFDVIEKAFELADTISYGVEDLLRINSGVEEYILKK